MTQSGIVDKHTTLQNPGTSETSRNLSFRRVCSSAVVCYFKYYDMNEMQNDGIILTFEPTQQATSLARSIEMRKRVQPEVEVRWMA